jgi:hypothetical protein
MNNYAFFTKDFRRPVGHANGVTIYGFKIYLDGNIHYIFTPPRDNFVVGVRIPDAVDDPYALELYYACCELWKRYKNQPEELVRLGDMLADDFRNTALLKHLHTSQSNCSIM